MEDDESASSMDESAQEEIGNHMGGKNVNDDPEKPGKKEDKQSNTIMQQINNFSLTPMNDKIADQTIEDHKYLLELVENKCAIAFFACVNRNQSLFNALTRYLNCLAEEDDAYNKRQTERERKSLTELKFKEMIQKYDFMSVVMYPDLKNRRDFIHDCWIIAKETENEELKLSITGDKYFFLTREDLLELLKTHDNKMITHILNTDCMLQCKEDISYTLIAVKHA